MLSNVVYPSLSGTSVFTDFVELPSQLYEHWQEQPQVLQQFARHYQTGEPLPEDLLKRFIAARKFNQGFATVEFVSSALMDLEFHTQPAASITTCGPSRSRSWRKSACRRRSRCATVRPSSATSSPAITMRRAITVTCGPR
jgi:Zn-dependent oligopeptidase